MTECGTCCEKHNNTNHKKVECPFCDFTTCRTCIQTYITSSSNDAHCMSCKKVWNREFLQTVCSQTFLRTDYKLHRETVLLEKERCLLPAAQEHVVVEKQRRNIVKLLEEAQQELERQRDYIFALEASMNRIGVVNEKRQFVRKCPVENCRGFLSNQWTCDICENLICSECNEVKQEGHQCDPKNVETVKLLKKDTKPCPSCGTMIFKISGCDQMWCPDCHTAFSWKTGVIETGVVHNPHYYEFQRTTGLSRNFGDIPCGGMPSLRELYDVVGNDALLFNIHRLAVHVQVYELGNDHRPDNLDLRVQYLMNEIDEKKWKRTLQCREKAYEKRRDITNILTMFSHVSADLLRQLVVGEITKETTYDSMEELRKYTNNTFDTIMKRYNCTCPWILEDWSYCTSKIRYDNRIAEIL